MTYQEATKLLTGRCRDRRKLENNTYLERHHEAPGEDSFAVRLHSTDVLLFLASASIQSRLRTAIRARHISPASLIACPQNQTASRQYRLRPKQSSQIGI